MNDQEKLQEGLDALMEFFDQLGPNDIYKQILLEVLFHKLQDDINNLNEELFTD
jgi:hypothetical protein